MTPEHAKALLPIIQAFAAGKTIEFQAIEGGPWFTLQAVGDGAAFNCAANRYRVKADSGEPPHDSADACDWAKAFVANVLRLPHLAVDVDVVTGWFANAMVAAVDDVRRNCLRVKFEYEDELPEPAGLRNIFPALYRASQLGLAGEGGVRVYPYVEKNGQRFYLAKLDDA